jgi:uncharacterized protein
MSQPAKAHEPSMEEILASIRRIISDDDTARPAVARPAPTSPAAATTENGRDGIDSTLAGFDAAEDGERHEAPADKLQAERDRLALTESMRAETRALNGTERRADTAFDEVPRPGRSRTREQPHALPVSDRTLLSPRTTAAVDTAFNSLAHTVLTQNSCTLEDLVREMLKPMLKAWLDDNLPGIVERLVRAEIERVSRGRG